MRTYNLYQTLENRENADEVEIYGPYICQRKDSWLGDGYYFWETFVDHAHKWGQSVYDGNYFICQSVVDYDKIKIYDLDDTRVIKGFSKYIEFLSEKYNNKEDITVPFVIRWLRKHNNKTFDYDAIRVRGDASFLEIKKVQFKIGKRPFLLLNPVIQVCIFNKCVIGKGNFRLIYPENYISEYTI